MPMSSVDNEQVAAARPKARGHKRPVLNQQCPDCEQQFDNKIALNIHRLKEHVASLENLPCPKCNQEFSDLTTHMQRFHNVDGIVCPHCGSVFSKKCALNRHIKQVHLNIQMYTPVICPVCKKVFSKKGHMDRHIKIFHQGMRNYSDPCPYCKKTFTTRANLGIHITMVHERVRKKCEICNKLLADLHGHMRSVHGIFRRKAKIPKDLIGESDNPESDILPLISGTKPSQSRPGQTNPNLEDVLQTPQRMQYPIPPAAMNTIMNCLPGAQGMPWQQRQQHAMAAPLQWTPHSGPEFQTMTSSQGMVRSPQAGTRQRNLIWRGELEWQERVRDSKQKITYNVQCNVSMHSGMPEVRFGNWPSKLTMQVIPKSLVQAIGVPYFRNSRVVLFHFQECKSLVALNNATAAGFAGCVHFTGQYDMRVLILVYSNERKAYLGLIPNDQVKFVDRFRTIIQQEKRNNMQQQQQSERHDHHDNSQQQQLTPYVMQERGGAAAEMQQQSMAGPSQHVLPGARQMLQQQPIPDMTNMSQQQQ